ncbi:MAG: PKD domain-containing protein [Anaerolineae bacterium]|nr:MAG: PKD domain-containing protein [Anaerolineae bacterium]
MSTVNPRTSPPWILWRVILAFGLFFSAALAGSGGQALAVSAGQVVASPLPRRAVLPLWLLVGSSADPASIAPPASEGARLLAAPTINSVSQDPDPGSEGSPVTVTIVASDTVYYSFDWDDDGNYEVISQTTASASNTWYDDGPHPIRVRACDVSACVTDTAGVIVDNVAPTVEAGNDKAASEGASIPFTGASFSDPGVGDTHEIEWDFGDGEVEVGTLMPSHIYTDNGTYLVTLTVRDDDGGEGNDTLTVNVSNAPPNVLAWGDDEADEGVAVALHGSFNDPGAGDTHEIEWDFDDGTTMTDTQRPSHVTHVYTAAGTYNVTFTVRDDDGGEGSEVLPVTVHNVPPTAVISGPATQTAGVDAILDGSGSTEPGQNIVAYDWDLDDDGQYDDASGVTATLNRTVTGIYTVSLIVTDTESTTSTAWKTITIVPAPLHHFVVSVPSSGTAGVGVTTAITAEDEYGNVITGWDQDVTLSTANGGTINPSVAQGTQFVNGVWSGLVSLTSADDPGTSSDDRDVTATYSGSTGQDKLHIEPAAANELAFSAVGQQAAGVPSGFFNLTAYDAYDNLDYNYNGLKSLSWSGLTASPDGTPPSYPAGSGFFVGGVEYGFRFTAYAAVTNVTLTVTADDGPTGASNPFTVTHGAASTFIFSAIADQVAGVSSSFSLTVEDDYGNRATSYTGLKTLSWGGLGDSPNGDAPDYPPDQVNFSSGTASLLAFTPYLAEVNAQITAVEGAASGASNLFDVSANSQVGEIAIESQANGQGSEVTTHDMVVRERFTVYAAGYDDWGNYIADKSVTWSGTGVAQNRVSPGSGTSTTLTPIISGTGTIQAQYPGGISDATGLITVRAPVLTLDVTDSPDPVRGDGTLVYTVSYANTGNANATSVTLTANYDGRLNFVTASPAPSSGNNTWYLGTLPGGGGTGTVVITLTTDPLAPDAMLSSLFRLRSAQTDWISDEELTAAEAVDLSLSASYDDDTPYPGKRITYTLSYTNVGDIPATGVALTAQLPGGTTYLGQGWTPLGGGSYRYPVGALGAGAGNSVRFIVLMNDTGDGRLPSDVANPQASFSIADDGLNGPELDTADNQASGFIGIPDLVIDEIRVAPEHPIPEKPVTFTVVVRNQGTGWAWDPADPTGLMDPNKRYHGFWVDLFIDPAVVPTSYPWNGDGDKYVLVEDAGSYGLAPGQTKEVNFVLTEGLSNQTHQVYAKADNIGPYPLRPSWQQHSLVPESNEENNVASVSVVPGGYRIFLPIVLNNQ